MIRSPWTVNRILPAAILRRQLVPIRDKIRAAAAKKTLKNCWVPSIIEAKKLEKIALDKKNESRTTAVLYAGMCQVFHKQLDKI